MDPIATYFLSAFAGKVFDILAIPLDEIVSANLKDARVKKEYERIVERTIDNYLSSRRIDLRPTPSSLTKDLLLKDPAFATEFAKGARGAQMSADKIAEVWERVTDPEQKPQYTGKYRRESQVLLDLYNQELRESAVFSVIATAKDIHIQGELLRQLNRAVNEIERSSIAMTDLLRSGYRPLDGITTSIGSSADEDIRQWIVGTTQFIADKTQDFSGSVGRKAVFDEITAFMKKNTCGYCYVEGDPGIGKTSLAAQWIRENDRVIHHFVSDGHSAHLFMRNVCAQLMVKYDLVFPRLPVWWERKNNELVTAEFLNSLLEEISHKRMNLPDKRCVIVIDGLDEVLELDNTKDSTNILSLPRKLPEGVFIIITSRRGAKKPSTVNASLSLEIKHDSEGNLADIREFVETSHKKRPGVAEFIRTRSIANGETAVINDLCQKSEGNFLYLHYLFSDMDAGIAFGKELPQGLQQYYRGHWDRMNMNESKIRVLIGLLRSPNPVPILEIAMRFHEPNDPQLDPWYAKQVLMEWDQFLHKYTRHNGASNNTLYHLYHRSFHDFLEEQVGLDDIEHYCLDFATNMKKMRTQDRDY